MIGSQFADIHTETLSWFPFHQRIALEVDGQEVALKEHPVTNSIKDSISGSMYI